MFDFLAFYYEHLFSQVLMILKQNSIFIKSIYCFYFDILLMEIFCFIDLHIMIRIFCRDASICTLFTKLQNILAIKYQPFQLMVMVSHLAILKEHEKILIMYHYNWHSRIMICYYDYLN